MTSRHGYGETRPVGAIGFLFLAALFVTEISAIDKKMFRKMDPMAMGSGGGATQNPLQDDGAGPPQNPLREGGADASVAPGVPGQRHVYIPYASPFSGSVEVRQLNNAMATGDQILDNGCRTPLKLSSPLPGMYVSVNENSPKAFQYCKMYDIKGDKKNEPFFDAIVTYAATLSHETFGRYFNLKPVQLGYRLGKTSPFIAMNGPHDDDETAKELWGREHYHFSQDGSVEFLLQSSDTSLQTEKMSAQLRAELYRDHQHVFLLSPMTESVLEEVRSMITQDQVKYVFHFQGEAVAVDAGGGEIPDFYKTTSKGNLFKNSFNQQNSMRVTYELRKLFATHADCYTPTLRPAAATSTAVAAGPSAESKSADGAESNGDAILASIPDVWKIMYGEFTKLMSGSATAGDATQGLTFLPSSEFIVTLLVQDVTDKDNYLSVAFLTKEGYITAKTDVIVVHKEMYDLYVPRGDSVKLLHQIGLEACFPPYKQTFMDLNGGCTFPFSVFNLRAANEFFWPSFKGAEGSCIEPAVCPLINYAWGADDGTPAAGYVLNAMSTEVQYQMLMMNFHMWMAEIQPTPGVWEKILQKRLQRPSNIAKPFMKQLGDIPTAEAPFGPMFGDVFMVPLSNYVVRVNANSEGVLPQDMWSQVLNPTEMKTKLMGSITGTPTQAAEEKAVETPAATTPFGTWIEIMTTISKEIDSTIEAAMKRSPQPGTAKSPKTEK